MSIRKIFTSIRFSRLNLVFFGILFFYCCQKTEEASVRIIGDDSAVLLPMHLLKVKGRRDGYYAYIHAKFVSDNHFISSEELIAPDSIIMEISIKIGVPSQLSSGNYRLHKNRQLFKGSVSSSYIYFTGGQGGLPGFGGVFLFKTSGGTSYKINLPPAELKRR